MKNLISELRVSVIATLSLAVIVCGIYPLAVWSVAQTLFPEKANGSLIYAMARPLDPSFLPKISQIQILSSAALCRGRRGI